MSVWRQHLAGVETLFKFLASKYRGTSNETIKYARSFITYHTSIASLTTDLSDGLDEVTDEELGEDSSHLSSIDLYMGCSESLFIPLRRVMRLRQMCDNGTLQIGHMRQEVESILGVLCRRRWRLEYFSIPGDMPPTTSKSLQHVAQAFESCLLVCLHSIIEDKLKTSHVDESNRSWTDLSDMLPGSKEEALQDCIREMDLVPMDGHVEAGLLPLLFVVA
ncbi:hypothetical protein FSARC_14529, partial [Fusarium sarcochroum]